MSILDVESPRLDSALKVCFPPASTKHLLVATSGNKILWVCTKTGRLLREVTVHNSFVVKSMNYLLSGSKTEYLLKTETWEMPGVGFLFRDIWCYKTRSLGVCHNIVTKILLYRFMNTVCISLFLSVVFRFFWQLSKVHKHYCSSLAVSDDGRFLLTAEHKAVKVFDYNMQLDINSQVGNKRVT